MEKIALMGTNSKNRKWIKRTDYEKLYEFILIEVQAKPGILLQELLDVAAFKMVKQFPPSFFTMFLQVKHDMEARGIIHTNFDDLRNQYIRPRIEQTQLQNFVIPRYSAYGL